MSDLNERTGASKRNERYKVNEQVSGAIERGDLPGTIRVDFKLFLLKVKRELN